MPDPLRISCERYFPRSELYAFLCGAGVSASPPSNLPTGAELVATIFDQCALADFRDILTTYFDNRENLTVKLSALKGQTRNRTLVVLGYSGSDDYDIMPALRTISDCNGVLWVLHSSGAEPMLRSLDEFELTGHPPEALDVLATIARSRPQFRQRTALMTGDTGMVVQILGSWLWDDPSYAPSAAVRTRWNFELDQYKPFEAKRNKLSQKRYNSWETVAKADFSSRLFAFVHDWLNSDLCLERAFQASADNGDPDQFAALLEDSAVVQYNEGRYERALYYGRQAYLAGWILCNRPAQENARIVARLAAFLQKNEARGAERFSCGEGAGSQLPVSVLVDRYARTLASKSNDPTALLLLLLEDIDHAVKGPDAPFPPDWVHVTDQAEMAVKIARALNEPEILLEALTRLFVVRTLRDPADNVDDLFREIATLKHILRRD